MPSGTVLSSPVSYSVNPNDPEFDFENRESVAPEFNDSELIDDARQLLAETEDGGWGDDGGDDGGDGDGNGDGGGWEPPPEDRRGGRPPLRITNARLVKTKGDKGRMVPVTMPELIRQVQQATDNWPRRCQGELFAPASDRDGIDWLGSANALMGWIGTTTKTPAKFIRSDDCHTSGELFRELQRQAKSYVHVEAMPHEPPLPDHYYACKFPEPGDGKTLTALCERFAPETDIDFELIRSTFVTVVWGGRPGSRPVFGITSDDGRGVGKSTLGEMNGHFAGGRFDVKPTDKFADIKQCLLSEGGATKRVGLLDNVKALRFSWAEFEGLVTSQTISGKRMYVGEADRPNNLLWFLSMNGPSLSKDLAQRTVFIKLKRPKHSGMWRADTEDFIAQNRTALIADCIAFLRGPRKPLAKYSRWASWERDILERLPDPAAAQALILERQNVSDVEEEEAGIVEDYFASQLRRYRYDPDQDVVFIPSAVLCDWYCRATNEKKSATQVTRTMNQAIGEGTVHRLFPSSRKDWGRGLMWRGVNSTPKTGASGDLESRMSSNDSY